MPASDHSPIIIPPRPSVLLKLQEIMSAPEPQIDAIAPLIKEDISL